METNLNRLFSLDEISKLQLAENLLDGAEQERQRIARDVHDDLKYRVLILKEYLHKINSVDFDEQKKQQLLLITDSLLSCVRNIAYNLSPKMLETYDIGTCLKLEFVDRNANLSQVTINTDYIQSMEHVFIAKPVELNLLRITQEAVQNAITHSNADEIVIQLRQTDNNMLVLSIHDNGNGFNVQSIDTSKSKGLKNLLMRSRSIGAILNIYSEVHNGTIVIVEYPL